MQRVIADVLTWIRATGVSAIRGMVVGIALVAVALAVVTRVTAPRSEAARALVGQTAPGFALRAVEAGSVGTQPVTLASMRGHPVLLVFTYTLCPHCLSETQVAEALAAERLGSGLRVLLVDSPAESPEIVAAYLQRVRGDTSGDAPVLLDSGGAVASAYLVGLYPTTVLIDGAGVVRDVWVGETDAATVRAAVESLSPNPLPAAAGRGRTPTVVVARRIAAAPTTVG